MAAWLHFPDLVTLKHTGSVVLSVTLAITSPPNEYHFANRLRPVCTGDRERRRDNRATGNNSNPQIIVLSGLEANEKLEYRERGWKTEQTAESRESGFRKR